MELIQLWPFLNDCICRLISIVEKSVSKDDM